MRKFKALWIMGICALVFCGQLGTSHSELRPTAEIFFDPSVPLEIKASLQKKIDDDHALLVNLLSRIEKMTDQQLTAELPQIEADFSGTYLKTPKNLKNGQSGWEEVIKDLRDIAGHANISSTTSVRLKFLPWIEGTEYCKDDIDFKATISTTLSGSPDVGLGGCLLHRRICTPIECE